MKDKNKKEQIPDNVTWLQVLLHSPVVILISWIVMLIFVQLTCGAPGRLLLS